MDPQGGRMTHISHTHASLRGAALAALLTLVAGCAVAPAFSVLPPDPAPPPHLVAEAPDRWIDRDVVWGGMIVEVRNYERYSEIEVLAYPLDEKQRPRLDLADQGRFIALLPGYVEANDYPQGRFLSLVGRITGERRSLLRDQPRVWPEVDVDRVFLWPRDFRKPRANFGIGIGVQL
jgi:outer membrane lipoprotein